MKKLFGFALLLGTTITLSACGGIPDCKDELDECTYGGPYTEERTVEAGKRMPAPPPEPVVIPEPAPEPAPAPEPEPEPEPEPVVIQDVEIMRSAEPEFKQITK